VTPEQFLKAIRKGQAAPAYFFTGPESQLKREAIAALVALVPEGLRAFNVQIFHAFEDEVIDVLTAARSLPLMAARRIVVLRDIEKTRLDQARRGELLAEYLEAPAPETVFVVTTEDKDRAKALVGKHGDKWSVVSFNPLQGAALAAAVKAEAVRLGCTIDAAAVEELIQAAGEDRARLSSELGKLRSAVGSGGVIDGAAVARYAAGYARHGAGDFVDAIGRRDLTGSLRLLRELTIKENEFLGLLGMLGKRLRVFWYLAGGEREVPREFRIYPKDLERYRAEARRFTREEIERGLQGLVRLDDAVKSTAVPPHLLLEHFLLGFLPGR
jgi:DNA polymerase III subunit delta